METVDLRLENAKIPYRGSLVSGGVAIADGKLVAIRKGPLLPNADVKIDLRGMLLLPGVIDAHVHFRDPGLTWKEDFASGSMAAAAGGVTTVCDMPNCIPRTNSLKRFTEKVEIAGKKSYVDFALHVALPKTKEEGIKLMKAGAASFGEVFTYSEGDAAIRNFLDLGLTISVHAEDPRVLERFKSNGNGIEEFIRSRPREAEISEISRLLPLAENAHIHICHVTTSESVDLIRRGKKQKNKVTCEVTPHHLLLSLTHLRRLGPYAHVLPPLRSPADGSDLLRALRDGTIDIVSSDHAPHTAEEKEKGQANLFEAPPGVVGVETSLPLMLTLVRKGKLSLFRLIEAMCTSPAKIFGLRNESGVPKGTLEIGGDADLVVVDQKKKWKLKGKELHGKTKFTPFEGREVIGMPTMTFVRGKKVFEEGEIVGKRGYGKFIPRSS